MADVRMTLQTQRVLEVLLDDPGGEYYGLDVMRRAGLSSGSLYPILRRLEQAGWLRSTWEQIDPSEEGRPRRRNYRLTAEGLEGARQSLAELSQRRPHRTAAARRVGLAGGSL